MKRIFILLLIVLCSFGCSKKLTPMDQYVKRVTEYVMNNDDLKRENISNNTNTVSTDKINDETGFIWLESENASYDYVIVIGRQLAEKVDENEHFVQVLFDSSNNKIIGYKVCNTEKI